MNRRLLVKLSVLGPAMGALVVAGVFPPGFERIGWMVVTLVCAFAIGRARVENAFWHGVVVGFVVGALATLVEGIFFGSYIKNNAWVVDKFTNQPAGFDLRIFIMMLVPFIGLAGGLVTGFVTYLVDRAMQARRESP